jgi:hypothetical protein
MPQIMVLSKKNLSSLKTKLRAARSCTTVGLYKSAPLIGYDNSNPVHTNCSFITTSTYCKLCLTSD